MVVVEQDLILKQSHHSSKERANKQLDVVVVVTFDPFLHEMLIFVLVDNNFITFVSLPSHHIFDIGKHPQNSTLFDFDTPTLSR